LLSGCNQAKNEGYIEGFVEIKNIDGTKISNVLKAGFLVCIAIRDGDRNKADKGEFITLDGGSEGHAILIVDEVQRKGEDAFKVINSRGTSFGDNGYFYIRKSEIGSIVAQAFALIDKDDTGNFQKIVYKQKIQQAINLLSENHKYAEPNEQSAMSICASILRRACNIDLNNIHSIEKAQIIRLLDQIGMK
jgi:C1A family cysteine protease